MWVTSLVLTAPTEGLKKYSEDIDLTKLYEPNPPVTHRVYMTVEYEDPLTEKAMRHNFNIDLYGTVVPLTIRNFVALSKGVKARVEGQDPNQIHVITYRESLFTQVAIDSFMQGGMVAPAYGPFSIHGSAWADENFDLKHDRVGRVSMANKGKPDTNNSEFIYDTKTDPTGELDNKNVVFGQISAGLKELLDIIQYVKKDTDGRPMKPFKIVWAVPEEFRLGDQKVMHQKYLDDLAAFRAGDSSKGVTLVESLAPVKVYTSKDAVEDKVLYDSYSSSALKNILFVVGVVAACFGLYNYRDIILRKNSKIVSMR
ncbi:similar to Saccharomyces cerevisiae YCR069W CPR4 Peptidyl-prolyl cis- trans isomerase (cyclophilin), catalyzes the cis-trans isomerization of peptide bonds N-terminal to proline residues [Maudiozyma barnettii]|uniref:Similar to Saccharomyces cerevisiae YCR069W CPR4 Peptidyl-prolyl cis- trans isomerase (Cyclophilin), catalyzes the cis-trans isomerization of peptide bonds N-terminal to proline residues n=1 Tax=Maudiozyma barnettii TaxID=61262 RepID=A0A8H2VG14_9SACH|nr:peptidylprolyl isomerase family protein CPR4 [Kazachstania barnettii]CAB4254766.1 similar to Saccharomyces cerevisiae YCR069W CPR4 Peptidyl-prolyl cis- trans isomerase (cyclophilin), catalyzes the cis-trans isomerization of peptide bonds N-terminal to proline residues [Kazachstania barnettii]CAD1782895.1 similar to Saccharomyces cerevisiae YCR069W CPR4 Peptidyl-prolyl cis- trans isomerase (cyclophilin), catalyzes the cis-trans isomerization of peptide bonds N-terminal to proline residues [Kaza